MKIGKDYIGVGGGILIFNEKDEILLLKRGIKSKNEIGFWQKPGGEVDYGEKVSRSMKREVKEETGLTVEIWGYLPHTDHIIEKDQQHWVAFNYLGRVVSGVARIMEPQKCEELNWFSLENLPKGTQQTTRESVENFLKGKYIEI
ncbi:NUDIX domain-containing protein [bacterium]|jgi:8-oxo-dGTP diphosphatase|nr:NUDIX domain-containing protein [bacterium]MBT4251648.1 NUDIX domain-containing protein [bacterium]MBT4597697.1 NUDIX domain-containing protein [bacterium]MBT6753710.1 NUDIX domain-containing protein [bacterium]MBT7037847.1 NUDIX domain-containing protein [bacterium]